MLTASGTAWRKPGVPTKSSGTPASMPPYLACSFIHIDFRIRYEICASRDRYDHGCHDKKNRCFSTLPVLPPCNIANGSRKVVVWEGFKEKLQRLVLLARRGFGLVCLQAIGFESQVSFQYRLGGNFRRCHTTDRYHTRFGPFRRQAIRYPKIMFVKRAFSDRPDSDCAPPSRVWLASVRHSVGPNNCIITLDCVRVATRVVGSVLGEHAVEGLRPRVVVRELVLVYFGVMDQFPAGFRVTGLLGIAERRQGCREGGFPSCQLRPQPVEHPLSAQNGPLG